jgi:hypothetical protein
MSRSYLRLTSALNQAPVLINLAIVQLISPAEESSGAGTSFWFVGESEPVNVEESFSEVEEKLAQIGQI